MSVSFSTAAIERIIRDLDIVRTDETEPSIPEVLSALTGTAVAEGLTRQWEFDPLLTTLFGLSETAARLITILGLIELAHRCGYIDMSEIDGAVQNAVADAAAALRENLFVAEENAYRGSGVEAMLDRVASRERVNVSLDDQMFAAFESYLNLTRAVWSDEEAQWFLSDTHLRWSKVEDAAFLVSPRHFAAALVKDPALPMPGRSPEGGLSALTSFDWLASVLLQLGAHPAVRDDVVRHARWAYNAATIRARLNDWASQMSEWHPSGEDVVGEENWRAYQRRVFVPIVEHQARLGLQLHLLEVPAVVSDAADWTIDELRAQGRIGAALQKARQEAATLFGKMQHSGADDHEAVVVKFANACNTLAELGDADLAAAYLAPFLGYILNSIRDLTAANTAQRIVSEARGVAATQEPDETPRPQPRFMRLETTREEPRARRVDFDG